MKHLILTMGIGREADRFLDISLPLMRAYGRRIGAEVRVITQSIFEDSLMVHFNKVRVKEYLNDFERVLFLDADVVVMPEAADIFQETPADSFAAWDESSLVSLPGHVEKLQQRYEEVPGWRDSLMNFGVFTASQSSRILFENLDEWAGRHRPRATGPDEKEVQSYSEQEYFNWNLRRLNLPCHSLPVLWNWNPMCGYIHPRAHFVHFLGSGFFEPERDRQSPPQDATAKRLRQMAELKKTFSRGVPPAVPPVDLCVTWKGARCAVPLPHYFYPAGTYEVELILKKPKSEEMATIDCWVFGKKDEDHVLARWSWDSREQRVVRLFSTGDLSYPQFCFNSRAEATRVTEVQIRWREESGARNENQWSQKFVKTCRKFLPAA